MRILIVASLAKSLINFRGPFLARIVAMGHEVHAGAPDVDEATRSALGSLGVSSVIDIPMQRAGLNPIRDLAYMRALDVHMAKLSPDLVITYTIKPNIWGAFAARRNNIRIILMITGLGYAFTSRGGAHMTQRALRWFAALLYAQATRTAELVIFQNSDDKRDFIAAGCLADSGKARLVNGSGVDLAHYSRVLLPEAPIFLMISRLLKNKGVREYAEAAIEVKRRRPESRFLLVGYFDEGPDGIDRADLEGWVKDGLEFLGPISDVRPIISQARIYVLPSYREGTPRSVLEAMGMGRPVITTDVPGCRETVVPGETGLLVAPVEIRGLIDAMIDLIDNPDKTAQMAERSFQLAREKFDVDKVNTTLLEHCGISSL